MTSWSLRLSMGALAALGLLSGCGRTEAVPVKLADLQDRTLGFTLMDVDSLERSAAVGSHRFTLAFSAGSSCVRLSDGVTATFNGLPMRLEPGGVPDTGVGGREVCEPPRAYFDFDPSKWAAEPTEDIRIVLQDDSHTVRLVVREAKASRYLLREGGASTTLQRGQTHAWRWRPETDTLTGPVAANLFPKGGGAQSTLSVVQEGDLARVAVPAGTLEGTYILRLSGTAAGDVSTCEGVARCEGGLFHSEEAELSVVP